MLAANRSVSTHPTSSGGTSAQPTASKCTNNSNKAPQKPSTSGTNQPAASNQQPQVYCLTWL